MQPPPPGQSPYGPPPYGQPPYGQPPAYYGPPVKQGNGFAVAGLILAIFVPLLGLIFSIIGLVTSRARAGAGKALSIVGIVLSVVVGAGATIVVVELASNVVHSTAADPGCISAENDARQMGTTINADGTAITRDENNPSAVLTDLRKFQTDMQTLQGHLSSAQAQAQHQSVRAQIAALTSDIKTLNSSLQAVENGDTSQVSQLSTAATKLQTDGDALDSTCSKL
jgi:PHD/YefM family antitoxin component YafN of YafNO toxin-antitoxin module